MTEKEFEQPIQVRGNDEEGYEVMEGQHRYIVAKNNNLPLYYQIDNTLTLKDIVVMNTVKKSTDYKAYLKWYYVQAKNGDSRYNNYIIYNDFIKEHKLETQGHKAIMLMKGTYIRPNKMWESFRKGELEIVDLKKSHKLINQFDDIGKFLIDIRKLGNSVFYAYLEAFNHPMYDHKRMIHQLEKPYTILTKQIDKDAYKNQINKSYNKGRLEQNIIDLFGSW